MHQLPPRGILNWHKAPPLPYLSLPARPRQRSRDIDDVVAAGRRVFPVPGDTQPDLEIDAPHLLKLEAPVRKILRPFRHEADAKTGRDQRHQREGVVAGVGDIVGQIMLLELLGEIALAVEEVLPGKGDDLLTSLLHLHVPGLSWQLQRD